MLPIKLIKEPGFIFDLSFIFYLNFNLKDYIVELENKWGLKDQSEYFSSILKQFGDIPEDLYVFFHALENGRSFFTSYCFFPYKEEFNGKYSFSFLQNLLSDQEKLLRNLVSFYFRDLNATEVEQCVCSKDHVLARVKASDYSMYEKNKLYEFFFDPARYIQTLQLELVEKKTLLDRYYESNYQKLIDAYNKMSFETLKMEFDGVSDMEYLKGSSQGLYTSYCLLNKYCMMFYGVSVGAVYLLGCEYLTVLNILKNHRPDSDLCAFG